MKRILFCAGILALAASCTESELDTISVQEGSKNGITFQAVEEGGENASTRGGWTPGADNTYVPIWHAETDKIAVFATGVKKENTDWAAFAAANFATYKATKSAGAGQFTGIADTEILSFLPTVTEKKPATFVALYPASLTTDLAFASDKFTAKIGGITLDAQTQSDITGGGVYSIFPKWSATTAFPVNGWDAVGEKIALDFQRPLSGLVFSVKNADKYTKGGASSTFGLLKTVTITALGDEKDEKTSAVTGAADKLTLNSDATLEINVKDMTATTPVKPTAKLIAGTADDAESEIILTMTGGLEWSDEAKAYMVIAPIERTSKKQYFTVAYEFTNITITVEAESSKSWKAGSFYNFPVLDLSDAKYDYLVTGTGNAQTLTINGEKTLASIMNEAGTAVKWGANDATVAATAFTTIVCDAVLTDTDLKLLKNFTGLKKVFLNKNTTIPAKTFEGLATLTTIHMPAVTTIADNAFAELTHLDSLNLSSYQFEKVAVNEKFFKSTKTTLKGLNVSAVADMSLEFNNAAKLNFAGFTILENITLKEGVELSTNAFKGCVKLNKVNGAVTLSESAFEGCADLTGVNIIGTEIPTSAFSGCVKLVKVNEKQIAPTKVGPSAFLNTKAMLYMDLSKVTDLGASAFEGSGLKGISSTNPLITVGASSISANAFKNAMGITVIEFTNATSFGAGLFDSCDKLKEVKFHKVFKLALSTAWTGTFGATPANTKLFVSPEQTDYLITADSKKLFLPATAATTGSSAAPATTTDITFDAIAINK